MGLDTVELVWKIANEFSINPPDARWEQVTTVQNMYDIVAEFTEGRLTTSAIEEKVNAILCEHVGIEPDEISPEKSLTTDLGLD
ncbi:MAG: hypothetical protein QM726_15220 [Chitinophagaceae bacterium]